MWVCFKAVRLRDIGVAPSIPGDKVTEEEAGNFGAGQLFLRGIDVNPQVSQCNFWLFHKVGHSQTQQSSELFEPAAGERRAFLRLRWATVFVLRVFAPDDKWDAIVDRQSDGDGEDTNVLRPGDIPDYLQANAVELP